MNGKAGKRARNIGIVKHALIKTVRNEKKWRANMKIELDDRYIDEVFEALCEIPFEIATAYDTEPPTLRQPGIEQIIDQLQKEIIRRTPQSAKSDQPTNSCDIMECDPEGMKPKSKYEKADSVRKYVFGENFRDVKE